MTREEAKIFMSDRNDENPRLRWDNHVGIRTLHDRLIDEIYDDFESRTCENCSYYTDNGNCAGLQIKTDSDFYCKSWESK